LKYSMIVERFNAFSFVQSRGQNKPMLSY
jgi:hypothetical protein